MNAVNILEDISALVQMTDYDSLESKVIELDVKYPGFVQAFKENGTILTKDRMEIINAIKKLSLDEKLTLFAILAPFGFGKTVTIQKIINLINNGEIRYGKKKIRPVHLRLNREIDRGKIVLKLLKDLGVSTEESFLRLIYESIKTDELVEAACLQHNEDWIIHYLKTCFLKDDTLDLILNKASHDVLIRLVEKVIQSYEDIYGLKVVLIIDEVEHSVKGFGDPYVFFLAMIIRYCFERDHKEFVGIIAMTTTMIDQPQMPLFQALKDMGAGDVFDRIREKHISRELSLTPETATELVSRILNFYLNSLVTISKIEGWKEILDDNKNYGNIFYSYPISHDLLNYLSAKGLRSSNIGVIPDFRVYLTLIGTTIDTWLQGPEVKTKTLEQFIVEKETLDIKQFWEMNEKIREKVQDYISQGQILPAIFRQDIILWIEKQLTPEITKTLFRNILTRIVMEAVKTGKTSFNEEEISKQFDLEEEALTDFKECIPSQFREILFFEFGSLHIDLDKLQEIIVTAKNIVPPDPEFNKIKEYLDSSVDGVSLPQASLTLLLKKWKVEKTKDWSIDKDDKQILVEKTSERTLYFTENPNKKGEIQDRLRKSNRFDIGLIIHLHPDFKCEFIYPDGLKAQEKAVEEEIMETAQNLVVFEEYKTLSDKIDKIKSDLGEVKKFQLLTLILPTYFRFVGKVDYPSSFDKVNYWAEIENLFRNPPPACEDRWIEIRTGISPETQFKEVVSAFIKLIIIYGNEAKFAAYDEAIIWRHPKVKLLEGEMKALGFEKEWRDPPINASVFQDRIRKNYSEILPIDEITGGLKDKAFLKNTLQKALEWIKEETEKKGSISLSTLSDKFFGVAIEDKDGKNNWNLPIKGKRTLLLLCALSNYYGDTYIDRKNRMIYLTDPSQMAELQAEKIKNNLLQFTQAEIASKFLSNKDLDISKPRKYWQRLSNIMQDQRNGPKEKSQSLQSLIAEWNQEGLQIPNIETETLEEVTIHVHNILKNSVIEKKFRGVGQYLKEANACIALSKMENCILLNALEKLIINIELETNLFDANMRMTNIIQNLGNLTTEKSINIQPTVLNSLESLNTKLKRSDGENWSEKFKVEFIEVIKENCINIYESGKTDIEQTRNKVQKVIPTLTTEFTNDTLKDIVNKTKVLNQSFSEEKQQLSTLLLNWNNKYLELLKKRFLSEQLRTEIQTLKNKITNQLEDLEGLNLELNFVETSITTGKSLANNAESIYTKAIASFGNKEENYILELCDKYDYNIVALLKGEYDTDIQILMSPLKRTEKDDKANAFILKILEVASKNKLQLNLRW